MAQPEGMQSIRALRSPCSVALAGRKGAEAASDHGIERLATARRRAVETAYVGPVAGIGEMLGDQAQLPGLVMQTPAPDRLGCDAAVRKRDNQRRAGPQHARDIAQHLGRPCKVLDCSTNRGAVEFGSGE